MLRLRLFRKDDPTNQLDSRALDDGEISIGRDSKADWQVADPDRVVSRKHLTIASRGGLLTIRDTSANGVFLGSPRQRVDRDRAIPVGRGEAIQFGNYLLVVEEERRGGADPVTTPDLASPFRGIDETKEESRKPKSKPFDSALKLDPLSQRGPVPNEDAWDRPPDAPAGSWKPTSSHRQPEHSTLIGSEREWREPPPQAAEAGYGFDAPFNRPILEQPAVPSQSTAIPSDWMEPASRKAPTPPAPSTPAVAAVATPEPILAPAAEAPAAKAKKKPVPPPASDGDALFEHFCAGAGIDPNAFAGEDRRALMERLGGVYRQSVLGISDLMQERTALRNEYRMVRTTVQPQGNNPFKWVPPQRIAVELLRGEGSGYTTGERALNEALRDVKAHLLCMLAGMRSALAATFQALSPQEIESQIGDRNFLIKAQRDAALWAGYVEIAARLRAEADDSADGMINRAFRRAYEAQAEELGDSKQWQ
ncbi:type VI secretion system-associated FHA domain protein TagH [Sphingomonas sp. ASY06-1R]|uniref:type VI secretion system-associated FHA domain protein TagH n=1 Tax=Sphingomonas sp. ASY06-1R TaxID=3445771 RepID=UPI003FA238F1